MVGEGEGARERVKESKMDRSGVRERRAGDGKKRKEGREGGKEDRTMVTRETDKRERKQNREREREELIGRDRSIEGAKYARRFRRRESRRRKDGSRGNKRGGGCAGGRRRL